MSKEVAEKVLLNGLLPTAASQARLQNTLKAEIDWAQVTRRADFHQTTPLLRFNLARIGALDLLPVEVRREVDETSRLWAARHLAYLNETIQLAAALIDAGVPAVPLKGSALMLGGYYPQPGLRAALDIDLLVDPSQVGTAERIVEDRGYLEIPGRRNLRSRQRLANEKNHLWPRRGPTGLLLELHHRAFQFVRLEKDFGFSQIMEKAVRLESEPSQGVILPAPADLAFHLIHHSIVDLQSTHAILKTFADIFFIFEKHAQARADLHARARQYQLTGAVELAEKAVEILACGTDQNIETARRESETGLLFETALIESPEALADAARLFEYLDFSRHPLNRLGNLLSLVFTSRAHMDQLYGASALPGGYLNYLRRPFDLISRFNWAGLAPGNLRRVRRLRMLANRQD